MTVITRDLFTELLNINVKKRLKNYAVPHLNIRVGLPAERELRVNKCSYKRKITVHTYKTLKSNKKQKTCLGDVAKPSSSIGVGLTQITYHK